MVIITFKIHFISFSIKNTIEIQVKLILKHMKDGLHSLISLLSDLPLKVLSYLVFLPFPWVTFLLLY